MTLLVLDATLTHLESGTETSLEIEVKILGGELATLCQTAAETPVDLRYNKKQLLKLAAHLDKFQQHIALR